MGSPIPAPSTSKPGRRPFLGGTILFSSLFLYHSSQPWQKLDFLLDTLSFPALSWTDLLSLFVRLSGQEGELHPATSTLSHLFNMLLPLTPTIHSCMCVCLVTQLCPTLCHPMDCSPPGSSVYGIFPGKNTGLGCHFLLQGIFPAQGLNPSLQCLLLWQLEDSSPRSHL